MVFAIGEKPWFYSGIEGTDFSSITKNNNNDHYAMEAVDWVLVSLRTDASPESTVMRHAALLHQSGEIEFVDEFTMCNLDPAEDYYIVIEHRNHMIVMSHIQVPIVNGQLSYDFRFHNSYRQLLGSGQKEIEPGVYVMYAGNSDQSTTPFDARDINPNDLTKWLIDNGLTSSYFLSDLNLSGDVNVADKSMFLINNGLFSDVPVDE